MDLIKLLLSAVCMIFALVISVFSLFSSSNSTRKDKKRSKSKRFDRRSMYYGRHESEYTNLDDAQYHYALDRMKDEIFGGVDKKKLKTNMSSTLIKKKLTIHKWYNFETWDELFNNDNELNNYINDRLIARNKFLFNWDKVFQKVNPYVKNEKFESIGVIRLEPDGETLYVYDMEKSPTLESNDSYAAGVPYKLVKKYSNIPAYFLFHTHPMGINADPLPSDADIYNCLIDCYYDRFLGHVVIGEYGAIIYFINFERKKQLESGGLLKYFTYCYDLLSAWNSFTNSSGLINQKDRISFLEKWGFEMIIIPSSNYISDTYDKLYLPNVIHDKFINTKYELLDKLKEYIKKVEKDNEQKYPKKQEKKY